MEEQRFSRKPILEAEKMRFPDIKTSPLFCQLREEDAVGVVCRKASYWAGPRYKFSPVLTHKSG